MSIWSPRMDGVNLSQDLQDIGCVSRIKYGVILYGKVRHSIIPKAFQQRIITDPHHRRYLYTSLSTFRYVPLTWDRIQKNDVFMCWFTCNPVFVTVNKPRAGIPALRRSLPVMMTPKPASRLLVARLHACTMRRKGSGRSFMCAQCIIIYICMPLSCLSRITDAMSVSILQPGTYTKKKLPLPYPAHSWHPKFDGKFDAIGQITPEKRIPSSPAKWCYPLWQYKLILFQFGCMELMCGLTSFFANRWCVWSEKTIEANCPMRWVTRIG